MVTSYTYSYNSYTLRLKAVLHTLICKYELVLYIDRFAVLSKFKIRKWLLGCGNVEPPIQCRDLHKDVYPDLNLLCKLMTIQNRLTVHLKISHLKNFHSIFSVRFMVRKVGLVNSTSKKFLNRGPYQDQEKSWNFGLTPSLGPDGPRIKLSVDRWTGPFQIIASVPSMIFYVSMSHLCRIDISKVHPHDQSKNCLLGSFPEIHQWFIYHEISYFLLSDLG